MSGAKVEYSSDARRDAARLALWIGRQNGVDRAQVALYRIDVVLAKLARRPALGRLRPDYEGEPRSFSVEPWLIVYDPLPGGDGIYVLRILDSRRDITALLGQKS